MTDLRKSYYLISALLLMTAAFIYLSPSVISPDIVFPKRYDSVYVAFLQQHLSPKGKEEEQPEKPRFNPGDAGLRYESFSVEGGLGNRIDGWYLPGDLRNTQTIVLLHDIDMGRIALIETMRQLHDRGFEVYAYDLHAHGTSEGKIFSLGTPSVADLSAVLDHVRKKQPERLALFGTGVSCAIIAQYLETGGTADAIVLESPFVDFRTYLRRYAGEQWGAFAGWWYAVLERQQSELLQFPVYQLDLKEMSRDWKIPVLFVAGTDDRIAFLTETYGLYEGCPAPQKDLLLVKGARHGELAVVGGDSYYNGISTFLNTVMPKRQKPSYRKRLALTDDLTGINRPDHGSRTDRRDRR